jgi:hypothetical protein
VTQIVRMNVAGSVRRGTNTHMKRLLERIATLTAHNGLPCDYFSKIILLDANSFLLIRFEGFTALTTKNVVFWDIKTQSVPHRRPFRLRYSVQPVNAM